MCRGEPKPTLDFLSLVGELEEEGEEGEEGEEECAW